MNDDLINAMLLVRKGSNGTQGTNSAIHQLASKQNQLPTQDVVDIIDDALN